MTLIRSIFVLLIGLAQLPSSFATDIPIPAPPSGTQKAFILMDADSGRVLAEQNPDEKMEPASITKIMTAYLVFHELKANHIHMEDTVPISERAWRTQGSRMFVQVGTRVSVSDLVHGMIVQSGNDATVALAEHLAGSEEAFAGWMNKHAERMGLKNTHFLNPTGMPAEGHLTTVRDMAILTQNLIRDFPEQYKLFAVREFFYNNITQQNRNPLFAIDPTADGVKTGHTDAAQYCLVGTSKRDDMRLIAVVFGSKSVKTRSAETLALLNFGFRFYETHHLYKVGETQTPAKVWKGETDEVPLGVLQTFSVTIPRGKEASLEVTTNINEQIEAPVVKGQPYGKQEVKFEGKKISETALVALKDVPEGGLWKQLTDEVRMYAESFFN